MVFVKDEATLFDAPLDFVWRYIYGEGHDKVHTTTRKPKFEKISDVTFVYASERLLRGKWSADKQRISMFPPVCAVTEWIEGVLAGSKFVYVYSAHGEATRVDVYGEFTSPTLGPHEVESTALKFLEGEYNADAPAVRAQYLKERAKSPG